MGILERIARIIRAELNERFGNSAASTIPETGDDELRRIIEELSAQQPSASHSSASRPVGTVEWAYRTLGVSPSASNDEIKAAYRRAIRQVHPDRFASASEYQQRIAAHRAQEINRAYAILKKFANCNQADVQSTCS